MSKIKRILLTILLPFSMLFVFIGYASLSKNFTVGGSVEIKPGKYVGVYISDVKVISTNNIYNNHYNYSKPTNFNCVNTINSANSTITYEITLHNNSDVTYYYLGVDYVKNYNSNSLINVTNGIFINTYDLKDSTSSYFDESDWVPAQTYRTIYATFRYGSNAIGDISNSINFKFGLNMDSVQDEFLTVLNDKTSETGYSYLVQQFDQKYKESGTTTIGNIGDDKEIFNEIFGENLTVNIDGEEKPVTIIIERKDVDGDKTSGDSYSGNGAPTGCEYTLYITVEDLDNPGSNAKVYAVSYTCGADGNFYQIGELYEGTSTVEDYNSSDSKYDGAFDVSSWKASEKIYQVTNDISYKVGYEQGTSYDKYNTIEQLMGEPDQEFLNKVNNGATSLLKPVCNILYSYTHNNGAWVEYVNSVNLYKQGYDLLKTAFDALKPYCYIGNGAQEVKIQNPASLSRAELIPMLEAIQKAYDYYLEVN